MIWNKYSVGNGSTFSGDIRKSVLDGLKQRPTKRIYCGKKKHTYTHKLRTKQTLLCLKPIKATRQKAWTKSVNETLPFHPTQKISINNAEWKQKKTETRKKDREEEQEN